jgi:hypothetical protein
MAKHIDEALVLQLTPPPAPLEGQPHRIRSVYDDEIEGYHLRITMSGRLFMYVIYRVKSGANKGVERRYRFANFNLEEFKGMTPAMQRQVVRSWRETAIKILALVAAGQDPKIAHEV